MSGVLVIDAIEVHAEGEPGRVSSFVGDLVEIDIVGADHVR